MMIGNLEYFKVFYHTAKCGSVTGAAALLSISQPAVSQSLKQLEKYLGVPLFARGSRGVKLTAEGEHCPHQSPPEPHRRRQASQNPLTPFPK